MNNLKIMNYEDKPFDTGIHLEDVEYVYVTVISGDELLEIHINAIFCQLWLFMWSSSFWNF